MSKPQAPNERNRNHVNLILHSVLQDILPKNTWSTPKPPGQHRADGSGFGVSPHVMNTRRSGIWSARSHVGRDSTCRWNLFGPVSWGAKPKSIRRRSWMRTAADGRSLKELVEASTSYGTTVFSNGANHMSELSYIIQTYQSTCGTYQLYKYLGLR